MHEMRKSALRPANLRGEGPGSEFLRGINSAKLGSFVHDIDFRNYSLEAAARRNSTEKSIRWKQKKRDKEKLKKLNRKKRKRTMQGSDTASSAPTHRLRPPTAGSTEARLTPATHARESAETVGFWIM